MKWFVTQLSQEKNSTFPHNGSFMKARLRISPSLIWEGLSARKPIEKLFLQIFQPPGGEWRLNKLFVV